MNSYVPAFDTAINSKLTLQVLSLGDKPDVKTMLFALPFAIENLPRVRILIWKPCYFPCTAETLKKVIAPHFDPASPHPSP